MVERMLSECPGAPVEAGEVVAALADEPDLVGAYREGIARAAGVVGHRPFVDLHRLANLGRLRGQSEAQAQAQAEQGGEGVAHGLLPVAAPYGELGAWRGGCKSGQRILK